MEIQSVEGGLAAGQAKCIAAAKPPTRSELQSPRVS